MFKNKLHILTSVFGSTSNISTDFIRFALTSLKI